MTSSQIILVAVTSALVAVFAMLLVASLKRARSEDEGEPPASRAPGSEQGKSEPKQGKSEPKQGKSESESSKPGK